MNVFYTQFAERSEVIYTNGCYDEFEKLINMLLPTLAGIGLGVIVLEVRICATIHYAAYIALLYYYCVVGQHLSLNWTGH